MGFEREGQMSSINGFAYNYQQAQAELESFEKKHKEVIAQYQLRLDAATGAKEKLRDEAASLSKLGETISVYVSPVLEVKVTGVKKWNLAALERVVPSLAPALTLVKKEVNAKAAQAMFEAKQISQAQALEVWEADTPRVVITLIR